MNRSRYIPQMLVATISKKDNGVIEISVWRATPKGYTKLRTLSCTLRNFARTLDGVRKSYKLKDPCLFFEGKISDYEVRENSLPLRRGLVNEADNIVEVLDEMIKDKYGKAK